MLTVDLIVCTMEEMKAMGAPMASLFAEAEPCTLDVATSSDNERTRGMRAGCARARGVCTWKMSAGGAREWHAQTTRHRHA